MLRDNSDYKTFLNQRDLIIQKNVSDYAIARPQYKAVNLEYRWSKLMISLISQLEEETVLGVFVYGE